MSGRNPEPGSARTVPFFDQGLFLLHLNRGKEELRRGRHDEARRELEEARRYRPHDPEVLASLSFALFHAGLFEDAESVTREVLATHPGSVPLLFNLGLILFKSGRALEAREPLERVLHAHPGHRKASLTLGLVLQRLGETEKARDLFHKAGADRTAGGDDDDTVSRVARVAVTVPAPEEESVLAPAAQLREDRRAQTSPIVRPEPLEDAAASGSAVTTAEVQPLSKPAALPEPAGPPRDDGVVAPPSGPFTPMHGGFLVANARNGLYIRRTALAGRRGAPVLEAERGVRGVFERYLVRASGPGSLLLLSRGRRAFLSAIDGDFLSVDPSRLLAFEASLAFREDPAFELRRKLAMPFLKLFGSGSVALSVATEPALFDVDPASPLTLEAGSVLGYRGDVQVELAEGADPLADSGTSIVLRFNGTGAVLAVSG